MTGTLGLHDANDELPWTFPNLAGPGTIILYLFHRIIFQVVCDYIRSGTRALRADSCCSNKMVFDSEPVQELSSVLFELF